MPLTGLVFHYDAFISDDGQSPCEAAFLSSDSSIKIRVLCSPTNIKTIEASSLCNNSRLSQTKLSIVLIAHIPCT